MFNGRFKHADGVHCKSSAPVPVPVPVPNLAIFSLNQGSIYFETGPSRIILLISSFPCNIDNLEYVYILNSLIQVASITTTTLGFQPAYQINLASALPYPYDEPGGFPNASITCGTY